MVARCLWQDRVAPWAVLQSHGRTTDGAPEDRGASKQPHYLREGQTCPMLVPIERCKSRIGGSLRNLPQRNRSPECTIRGLGYQASSTPSMDPGGTSTCVDFRGCGHCGIQRDPKSQSPPKSAVASWVGST
jgi:hypothetical protein